MTFEEWLSGPSGFGNFTKEELFTENMPTDPRDFFDEMRQAYKAGFNACRDKWGGLDYEQTCGYEEGGGL